MKPIDPISHVSFWRSATWTFNTRRWEVYELSSAEYRLIGGVHGKNEHDALARAILFAGDWLADNSEAPMMRVSVIEVDCAGGVVKPGGGFASVDFR